MATRSKSEREELFQRFYAVVDSIPRGRVATYGQVAREAGLPRHARHVGRALRELPEGTLLPWHRVLNASGRVSPRPGSWAGRQEELLASEGVTFGERGGVDLGRYGWEPDAGEARLPRGRSRA